MTSLGHEEDDGDLDRLVAELIAKEAREKGAGGARRPGGGDTAAAAGPSRVRPTNTRFLNRLMQDVETHNDALRREELRARAREHGNGHEKRRSDRPASSRRMRAWSDSDEEQDNRRAEDRANRAQHTESDRARETRRAPASHSGNVKRRGNHGSSRPRDDKASPPPAPTSKMDKYFSDKYDPALDVSAETRTDEKGLIEDDGWERMLATLKAKDDAKAERRAERKAEKERDKRKREEERSRRRDERHAKRRRHEDEKVRGDDRERRRHRHTSTHEGKDDRDSLTRSSSSSSKQGRLLDTSYTSRGAPREWDKGKVDLS